MLNINYNNKQTLLWDSICIEHAQLIKLIKVPLHLQSKQHHAKRAKITKRKVPKALRYILL